MAIVVTVALSAGLDALVVRLRRHRPHGHPAGRPSHRLPRAPAHC
ncbi:hypothetical protein ABZX85_20645 [Streptomyces sp. NPDC004539]